MTYRTRKYNGNNNSGRICFLMCLVVALLCLISITLYIHNDEKECNYHDKHEGKYNLAIELSHLHLNIIKKTFGFLSPLMVSRALAFVKSAMYNSITPYIDRFEPAYEECKSLKKIKVEQCHSIDSLKYSILVSVDKVVNHIFKSKPVPLQHFNQQIKLLYDELEDKMMGSFSFGKKVGKKVAKCIIKRFIRDGSNELGDEPGTINNELYSDNSNYYPVNPPQDDIGITNCSKLNSLNHWQQLKIPNPSGGFVIRKFLSPHAILMKPFALKNALEVMPPPPPQLGTSTNDKHIEEIEEVIQFSANLDDYKKVTAEYWADGPDSTLPPGHWHDITIKMLMKKNSNLIDSVLALFLQANAVYDAGIAVWTAKRVYDFVRPITSIQCYKQNQLIQAWKGPYQGVGTINGGQWKPYQNKYFVTPPFAEYTSGHSGFSGASAEVLKRFFGSDEMGLSFTVKEGESLFEPKITAGNPGYIAGVTDVPNSGPNTIGYVPASDVTLSWNTFTEAANEAGISRLYGGIHFNSGNVEGMNIGRAVGKKVYEKFEQLTGYQPPKF